MLLMGAVVVAPSLRAAAAADEKPAFKDEKEKASYAVGVFVGNQIKRSNMEVDLNVLLSAVNDVLGGKELRLNDMQASEAIRTYQQEARKKVQEGDAMIADGKRHEGVDQYKVAWQQAQEALKKS